MLLRLIIQRCSSLFAKRHHSSARIPLVTRNPLVTRKGCCLHLIGLKGRGSCRQATDAVEQSLFAKPICRQKQSEFAPQSNTGEPVSTSCALRSRSTWAARALRCRRAGRARRRACCARWRQPRRRWALPHTACRCPR